MNSKLKKIATTHRQTQRKHRDREDNEIQIRRAMKIKRRKPTSIATTRREQEDPRNSRLTERITDNANAADTREQTKTEPEG